MNQTSDKLLRQALAGLVGLLLWVGTTVAGPFSNLFVFGDSLSDVGNISQSTPFFFGLVPKTPGPYYWNGRFSNGPVYAETLATGLGLPALVNSKSSGNDFAYGGALTTGSTFPYNLVIHDVDDQVGDFLAGPAADPNALFVVFAGANDLNDGQTNMSVPVNSLQGSMNQLIADGARQFLVLNLPPLGETPRYNGSQTTRDQYDARSQQFNSALATMLDAVQTSNPAVTVFQFDVFGLFNQVLANPADFGLTNVTSSAAPGLEPGDTSYDTSQFVANPDQYLFWDDLHPTAAVHAILGQRVLDLFRLPGDFNHDGVVDAADYIAWRSGVGTTYIPDDYNVWRAHFGQTEASGSVESSSFLATVPEPSAVFLGLVSVAWLANLRRRTKRIKTRFRRCRVRIQS